MYTFNDLKDVLLKNEKFVRIDDNFCFQIYDGSKEGNLFFEREPVLHFRFIINDRVEVTPVVGGATFIITTSSYYNVNDPLHRIKYLSSVSYYDALIRFISDNQ